MEQPEPAQQTSYEHKLRPPRKFWMILGGLALACVLLTVAGIIGLKPVYDANFGQEAQRQQQLREITPHLPADAQSLVGSLRIATPHEKVMVTAASTWKFPDQRAFAHIYVATKDFHTVATRTPMIIVVQRGSGARWMGGAMGQAVVLFDDEKGGSAHTAQYDWLCQLAKQGRADLAQCSDPAMRHIPSDRTTMLAALRPLTPKDVAEMPRTVAQEVRVIQGNIVLHPASRFGDRLEMLFENMSTSKVLGGDLGLHSIVYTNTLNDGLCHRSVEGDFPSSMVGPEVTARYSKLCPRG